MQRLEAFLDLSVPIVDDESSKLELEESFRRRPGRACKKVDSPPAKSSAKKSTPPPESSTTASEDTRSKSKSKSKKEDFLIDSSSVDTSKMSKHQLKKLQKQNKKSVVRISKKHI